MFYWKPWSLAGIIEFAILNNKLHHKCHVELEMVYTDCFFKKM